VPGGHGKIPVGPVYAGELRSDGTRSVEDPDRQRHTYPDL
jgi:hypothetical protein